MKCEFDKYTVTSKIYVLNYYEYIHILRDRLKLNCGYVSFYDYVCKDWFNSVIFIVHYTERERGGLITIKACNEKVFYDWQLRFNKALAERYREVTGGGVPP